MTTHLQLFQIVEIFFIVYKLSLQSLNFSDLVLGFGQILDDFSQVVEIRRIQRFIRNIERFVDLNEEKVELRATVRVDLCSGTYL